MWSFACSNVYSCSKEYTLPSWRGEYIWTNSFTENISIIQYLKTMIDPDDVFWTNDDDAQQEFDWGNYTHPDDVIDSKPIKKGKDRDVDGCFCKLCKEFYQFAESNQSDGTLICWSCKNFRI